MFKGKMDRLVESVGVKTVCSERYGESENQSVDVCVCVHACMHVHFCRWDGSKKEQINGK